MFSVWRNFNLKYEQYNCFFKKKIHQFQQQLVVAARIKGYIKNTAKNLFPLIEYLLFY